MGLGVGVRDGKGIPDGDGEALIVVMVCAIPIFTVMKKAKIVQIRKAAKWRMTPHASITEAMR